MQSGITALRIDADAFVAVRDGEENIVVRRGNAADWDAVRSLAAGQRRLVVRVAETEALPVVLPARARNSRELRTMLGKRAPVLPHELAWTKPQLLDDGTAMVWVVRRRWLDERVEEAEHELNRAVNVIVEPSGARLRYRSPASRRRNRTTAVVVAASLIIGIAALALADRNSPPASDLPGIAAAAPVASGAGVAASLLALQFSAPAGAQLTAISADPSGRISIDLEAVDPDTVRRAVSSQAVASGWREAGQLRQAGGRYRITYSLAPLAPAAGGRLLAPLTARSRGIAVSLAENLLIAKARPRSVELQLMPGTGSGDGPLEFGAVLTGPQAGVLGLADDIESGSPPARFAEWRLQPAGAGVRLTGRLIVPWKREP